jgi:formate/nitrite transporter FocA (FNT family)
MDGEDTSEPPASQDPASHLKPEEKTQAAEHASPPAVVIHAIVHKEGEEELGRASGALAWSGLAAGLSMGFSFLALALIQSALPEAPWRRLIDSFGYSLGFVIVILGRQQLYTESTLSAVLPLLVRRDAATFLSLLRFWALVLSSNIVGTLIFARLISINGVFPETLRGALSSIARDSVTVPFWTTLVESILSGWLIALMVWLLPSAKSAKLLVIMLITYTVAIGRFSHIVAGSVEGFYAVFDGQASPLEYITGFFVPTLIGNTIGGVALVAILNHAPLAPEFAE